MAKKSKNSYLFSALLYIVLGVVLIVFRSQALDWAMTIAGALCVISGVLEILRKNFVSGACSLIIGIAILVLGWTATQIVLLVLGILLAVKGLLALLDVIRGRRSWITIIFALLNIAVGVVIAFGNGLDQLLVVCGALLIVDGLLGVIASFKK
ncbi:MAG: DUF308 domain-containing protein [Clostridia bacterium]|nr:DUF308 domain-containing protein [Clostridia bacterium]